MSDNISVRFATGDDLSTLVDMQVEFEQFFQDIGVEKYDIDADARRHDLYDIHFGPNAFIKTLIVMVGNEIAGRVSFYRGYTAEVPPYYHLQLSVVYIRPQYRGTGAAIKLFDALRDTARAQNIHEIKWSVWGKNPRACRFYNKIGAQRFSDHDEHFMFWTV